MSKVGGMHYVNPNDEQIQSTKIDRAPKNDLDKDAFMQLLVTQLRYQDPLNPMDNQEFMAQMAQFSALEQMMNMSSSMDKSNAYALIGKTVEGSYKDPTTNQIDEIFGNVDRVITRNGKHFLLVEGREIEMKDIHGVIDPALVNETEITSGFELIGKTVQASITNKETSKEFLYEGEVQKIIMKNGNPHVVIGLGDLAVTIPVDNVKNIIEKPTITGKHAKAVTIDEGGNSIPIEGIVEYILVIDGEIQVSIEGMLIPFSQIETVSQGKG